MEKGDERSYDNDVVACGRVGGWTFRFRRSPPCCLSLPSGPLGVFQLGGRSSLCVLFWFPGIARLRCTLVVCV